MALTDKELIQRAATKAVNAVMVKMEPMVNAAIAAHERKFHAPDPVIEPPPPPPPPIGLQPSGMIDLGDGDRTLEFLNIEGQRGINAENNRRVGILTVRNCVIDSFDYGLYLGSCDEVRMNNASFSVGPGDNSYCVRGNIRRWVSQNCMFDNNEGSKACWRVYGLSEGSATNDIYRGGRMMLGGGPANEHESFAEFKNFTFSQCTIDVETVGIYPKTSGVRFDRCDFTGSGEIGLWGGCRDIVFANCTKGGRQLVQADIKLGKDQDGQQVVNWSNAKSLRGIEVTQ